MRTLSKNKGFTLLELMVVTAILSIMASIAGFGIKAMLPIFRIRSASLALKSDMQMARLQAIRHNTFVVCQIDVKNSTYTIFRDDGGGENTKAHNYVKDDGEKVFKEVMLHPNISILKAKFGIAEGRFAFNSRGALDGLAGGIYLLHKKKIYRGVAISRIGKITIKRSTDGENWNAQD
jgi:prepilin-type N-terminal cleavage/methylation domain-containing protein